MRILQEQAIGLVIDIQDRLLPHIWQHDQLLQNSRRLIKGLAVLDVPILVTQQYTKGLGPTVPDMAKVLGKFEPIEKLAFACCDVPEFMLQLAESKRQRVIIAGIESHVCVLQTVIDLLNNAYTPVVVVDCVSSRHESDKYWAIQRMQQEGALITTSESILFELCRYAGSETFKAISKLVK